MWFLGLVALSVGQARAMPPPRWEATGSVALGNDNHAFAWSNDDVGLTWYHEYRLGLAHPGQLHLELRYYGGLNTQNLGFSTVIQDTEPRWADYRYRDRNGDGVVYLRSQVAVSKHLVDFTAKYAFKEPFFVGAAIGYLHLDTDARQPMADVQQAIHRWGGAYNFIYEDYVGEAPLLAQHVHALTIRADLGATLGVTCCDRVFRMRVEPRVSLQRNVAFGEAGPIPDWQPSARLDATVGLGRLGSAPHGSRAKCELYTAVVYDPNEPFPLYQDSGSKAQATVGFRLRFASKPARPWSRRPGALQVLTTITLAEVTASLYSEAGALPPRAPNADPWVRGNGLVGKWAVVEVTLVPPPNRE